MHGLIGISDTLITPPTALPVSVDYAKAHIKSLTNAEDTLVWAWIAGATSYIEEQTGRQIMLATRERWLDRAPGGLCSDFGHLVSIRRIELPFPPLQEVVSVTYVDGDGNIQSFSDGASPETLYYTTKAPAGEYCERGWIEPIYGKSWPATRAESGAFRIRYTCGYGATPGPTTDGGSVPDLIVGLICFMIGSFDQNRSPEAFRSGFGDLPTGIQLQMNGFKYSAYPRQGPLR